MLDWLVLNQDNVSEWSKMWAVVSVSERYKNPTKHIGLVQSKTSLSSHRNVTCPRHDMAGKLLMWHKPVKRPPI
jgi:hypothetical protein